MTEKQCTKCGEIKPLEMFAKRTARCRPCMNAYSKAHYATNKERKAETAKAWAAANVEKLKAIGRAWYENNKERNAKRGRAWREANLERARDIGRAYAARNPDRNQARYAAAPRKKLEQNRAWKAANPDKVRAMDAKRRAAQLRATPAWADLKAIAAVYAEQQELIDHGIDCHVDHVIPLRGKLVCGLHVHNNLQLLLPVDNLRKGNKLIEELL